MTFIRCLASLGGVAVVVYAASSSKPAATTVNAAVVTNRTQGWHEPSVPWDNNWDKRDPASLVKPAYKSGQNEEKYKELLDKAKPKATRNIFLIRHGQYNMSGPMDSHRTLTILGKEQADLTGRRLKELAFPYSVLIHSTMTRATETANIIKKNLQEMPTESCDFIREGAPIPPEPPSSNWRPEALQFYEDGARIEAGFRKHIHRAEPNQLKDSYEVIVCHSNVIRYFVCRVLQFPPEAWLRLSLHNCSITWMTIKPNGKVVVRAIGDAGHIPVEKMTTT